MANAYSSLEDIFQRLTKLNHAMTFLQWDQLVKMPPKGNAARAETLAELSIMHHELLTSKKVGDLLADADREETDADIKKSLGEMRRVWNEATCISSDLVKAKSLAGSRCEHDWREQRRNNDWTGFLENFREVVKLAREEAQSRQDASRGKCATPYDALVDLYCAGDSVQFIESVFNELKVALPGLLAEVTSEERGGNSSEIRGTFPPEQQKQLSLKLIDFLGFDFEGGRLDVSMHPFSTGGPGDQRITTRYSADEFAGALLATAHETGHASYESGLPERWQGLPVGRSRNMCIHESQSLLFEKQIVLSRAFLAFFTPYIHQYLPDARPYSATDIWRACKQVKPSLIRVDADEVTYPLHVILRFEIEKALINGEIEADVIPDIWDEKMTAYLGISTRDDYRDGCLQDIHWTDGSFGYFPSYTLGALNSAQLFAAIKRDNHDWQERLQKGEVTFIREWLAERIWSQGSLLQSQELMKAATGEETNSRYFLTHLKDRYIESRY